VRKENWIVGIAFLLLLQAGLGLTLDSAFVQANVEGGQSATGNIFAAQQVAAGAASSASYKTLIGWLYSVDVEKPTIETLTPVNGASILTDQTVSFSLRDEWIGIERANTRVTVNGIKSSAFDAATQCSAVGTTGYDCSYTETALTEELDYNITVRALDKAGNENHADVEFFYRPTTDAGPGPGSIGEEIIVTPGGAPGGPAGGAPGGPAPEPCSSDSDCETGFRCVSGRCAKFFDVKIVRADTPIKGGQVFDFTYLVKNPLGKAVDAEMEYWLEKDGEKLVEGREVVFVGAGEEIQFESNLNLLEDMLGKYSFVVQLNFEGTRVFATKDIEVKTSVPLTLDLHISRLPPEIESGPYSIKILLGTNFDERVNVRLNQVIMRDNEIIWKNDEFISIYATKTIVQQLPVLPPGEYVLTMSVSSGEALITIARNISVKTKVFEGPELSDIIEQKAVVFSTIGLLLIIAAILAWHNLIVIRYISPKHKAMARMKFIYFTVFAIAFFILLGGAVWQISDLLREFFLNEFFKLTESGTGIVVQEFASQLTKALQDIGIEIPKF